MVSPAKVLGQTTCKYKTFGKSFASQIMKLPPTRLELKKHFDKVEIGASQDIGALKEDIKTIRSKVQCVRRAGDH